MKSDFHLDRYQGKNRLLFVFAASRKDPSYQEQVNQLAAEAEAFAERDLLLVCLFEQGESGIMIPGGLGGEPKSVQAISQEDASRLRKQFDVSPDAFVVVLVGKDGTEKRRNKAPCNAETIYADIDAMPTRRREMKQRR